MTTGDWWVGGSITWSPPLSEITTASSLTWNNLSPVSPFQTVSTISYGVSVSIPWENNLSTAPTTQFILQATGDMYYNANSGAPTYLFNSSDVVLYGSVPTASTAPAVGGGTTGLAATGGKMTLAYKPFDGSYAGFFQVTGGGKYNPFGNVQALWGLSFIEQ